MRSARHALTAGAAALAFVCAPSCAQFRPRPDVNAGMDLTAMQSGRIVVWISDRAGSYSRAVAASFATDFPNATLVERHIPQDDFVRQVTSTSPDEPAPDVAFIDNYRELQPLIELKAVLNAWGTSRFPTNGWWVIFKDTPHLAKASAFVRWLNRAPGWQPKAATDALSTQAREAVQKAAVSAFHALMSADHASLENLLDRDAAPRRFVPIDAHARFSHITPILTFGNGRIAFVMLSAVGAGDSFYGLRQMIFIFRNQGDGWRILQMDPNARVPIVNPSAAIELPSCNTVVSSSSSCLRETEDGLPPLLRVFDSRIFQERTEPPPPSAVLVEPADRAVLARFPRPYIAWRSAGTTDATYIVESQYWDPAGEGNWSVSRLTFADRSRGGEPFRQRAPFGVGKQPHQWRIWTLVPSGAVSVSTWRTVLFSN